MTGSILRPLYFFLLSLSLLYREAESKILGFDNLWFKLFTSLIFLAGAAVILFDQKPFLWNFPRWLSSATLKKHGNQLIVACLIILGWTVTVFQAHYYSYAAYQLIPVIPILIFLSAILFLIYSFTLQTDQPKPIFWSAFCMFLLFWVVIILSFPITAVRSDMLPLIKAAGLRFLSGSSPYALYSFWYGQSFGFAPISYLPMIWVPYLPLIFFNIDLRFASIMALGLIGYLFVWLGPRKDLQTFKYNFLLTLILFWLNPYILYRHETYNLVFILIFMLFLQAWLTEKNTLNALWLGIALAARQTLLPLLPIIIIYNIKLHGAKKTIYFCTITATVTLCLVLPFYFSAPYYFIYSIFTHFQKSVFTATPYTLRGAFNFSSVLINYGAGWLLQPIQILIVSIASLLAWFNLKNHSQAINYLSFTYLLFLMFNPHVMGYMYFTFLALVYVKEINRDG